MIASPSDVSQERRIVRDLIHEWNANHAQTRRVVLMPVGWETHCSPEMGQRPQAIINRQMLSVCDILAAVFWTRLGSPTVAAASGTVEEIEEHLAAGKTVLMYFSAAPVRLDSVDNGQYQALAEFKASCRDRGLIVEYEDLAEFRDRFRNDLTQTINRSFPIGTAEGATGEPSLPQGPPLSSEALDLLTEASKDPSGVIMKLGTMTGTHVQTNGRQFAEPGNARSEARWRRAVDELHNADLVEDRAGKGEVFFVTNQGYEMADRYGVR